jgi:hypothetical protein
MGLTGCCSCSPRRRWPGWTPERCASPDGELSEARFVPVAELDDYTIPDLAARLRSTFDALRTGTTPVYLEYGRPS